MDRQSDEELLKAPQAMEEAADLQDFTQRTQKRFVSKTDDEVKASNKTCFQGTRKRRPCGHLAYLRNGSYGETSEPIKTMR